MKPTLELPVVLVLVSLPLPPLQTPDTHVPPAAQTTPQLPQFAASDEVSLQTPPHSVSVARSQAHDPFSHRRPPGHALLHTPQWITLLARSTQLCPHCDKLASQPAAQALSEHTCVAAHAVPQTPQCAGSEPTSVQTPLQLVRPVWQLQLPPTQLVPAGHALSQAPQWAALSVSVTHAPAHRAWPC